MTMCVSSSSWLRGAMRVVAKQKDQEDDDACVVVFMAEKNCEGNNKARRLGR